MERYVRLLFFISAVLMIVACSEDEFPASLYDYQVERLLAGEQGKLWINSSSGGDPVFYAILADEDSIVVHSLSNSLLDTLETKKGSATSFELIFTDSIIFEGGDHVWLVQDIKNDRFQFLEIDQLGNEKDNLFFLRE
jgi:hypothetical protein